MATKISSKTVSFVSGRPSGAASAPVKSTNGQPKAKGSKSAAVVLTREKIAERAYLLWQQTGNGDEAYNWAEAERQLKRELGVK